MSVRDFLLGMAFGSFRLGMTGHCRAQPQAGVTDMEATIRSPAHCCAGIAR